MEKDLTNWEKFDLAVLEGKATWWQMELPSGDIFFGEAKPKILGRSSSNFKKYQDFTELIHPIDYEKTMQAMRDHLEGKKDVYETVYRIEHKDGNYIKFYDCGKIVEKNQDKTSVAGFVLKLDEQKDMQEQKESFKKMVTREKPSLVDVIRRIKQSQ
ncbi:MAG: PAS domain-containing protein [Candidatus Moraniibacteriota bacterium]